MLLSSLFVRNYENIMGLDFKGCDMKKLFDYQPFQGVLKKASHINLCNFFVLHPILDQAEG
ncbi:MAG TPA: hypothetical protein DD405_08005 [Desulfobacteraceae bacterium]|nr:hypothetical protein [Desulfobacteraceae bacterium]